jgi:hypothetical protein
VCHTVCLSVCRSGIVVTQSLDLASFDKKAISRRRANADSKFSVSDSATPDVYGVFRHFSKEFEFIPTTGDKPVCDRRFTVEAYI